MKVLKTISGLLDTVNKWAGTVSSWIAIPLMAVIVFDVIARKLGHPTLWGYETSIMVYGVYIMLVSGYGLLHDSLVKVDILSGGWSERTNKLVQLVMYLVCVLPFTTLMLPGAWESFFGDFMAGTRSWSSWGPVLWPCRLGLFVGLVLLWIQGISEILKIVIYFVENKGEKTSHKKEILKEGASE